MMQDLSYAFRLLRKAPGFAAIAIMTLGLGIGANTAVFSVVDAVMLRPLPYADPDRLVAVWEGRSNRPVEVDKTHGTSTAVAPANLADYVRENRSFESLAGYAQTSMALSRSGNPEQLVGESVTANYLTTLGVQPNFGRSFLPDEDHPGREHVVILTDRLWRRRFNGDAAIIGQSILLNGEPYAVVGVMPDAFTPLSQFGASVPVTFLVPAAYSDQLLASHGDHEIEVVGRLKPGVTVAQAQSDLDAIASGLATRYPREAANLRTLTAPLSGDIARKARTPLLVLLGAVTLVLLVACINVANLLIVRAVGQRREVAIRMAIGASRWQIARGMLIRGVVLGVAGGVAGLMFGVWTRDALVALAPSSIPRLGEIGLNRSVLAATAIISILTGVVAGLLPAWQAMRTEPSPALKSTELSAGGSGAMLRWRGALLAAEVAAAFVLAVGAGLLVRSLVALNRIDLGFQTDHVIAATIFLPDSRYDTPAKRLMFFEALAERMRSMRDVQAVAFANRMPMRGGWSGSFEIIGVGPATSDADLQAVSAGYFSALGIPLLRGRLIEDGDRLGAPNAAVVSETFARVYFGGTDPIGRQIRRNPSTPAITIVGVVGEVRRGGKAAAMQPEVYMSAAQTNLYVVRLTDFAIRTAGDPRALMRALQDAVAAIDADQPITNVRTLDEVLSLSMAERRFNLVLLSSFAGLAVLLAMIGVYGVVAYAATQRTREIGIRIALGATAHDVIAMIVRGGLAWTCGGVVIGFAAAWGLTRLMTTLLFDVRPTDPITFAAIAALMGGTAAAASYLPARRAASNDPIAALRSE